MAPLSCELQIDKMVSKVTIISYPSSDIAYTASIFNNITKISTPTTTISIINTAIIHFIEFALSREKNGTFLLLFFESVQL